MRALTLSILLSFSCSALAETPWERYVGSLSAAQADAVSTLEYSTELGSEAQSERVESDLALLATQVAAGDHKAFLLAVRLSSHTAPGAYLEDLDVMIGRYARLNPTGYLQAMDNVDLCIGIASPGLEFVDRAEARAHELASRASALNSVKSPSLGKVKSKCMSELKAREFNSEVQQSSDSIKDRLR